MTLTAEEVIKQLKEIQEKHGPVVLTNISELRVHKPTWGKPYVDLVDAYDSP